MYPLLGAQGSPSHPNNFNSSIMLQDHDGVVLSYLLSQQLDTDSSQGQAMTEEKKSQTSKKRKKAVAAIRKRSSGKMDRHSKICTANGPRERRMRLSVQIARKFFDLQDVLGFDKASKTIDWLFTKAKSAIEELKLEFNSPTSSNIMNKSLLSTTSNESNEVVSQKNKDLIKSDENRDVKKMMRCSRVGKRSRDEARERARERTREKQQRVRSNSCQTDQDEANPKDLGFSFSEEAKNSMMGKGASFGCGFPSLNGNWGSKMESFQSKMRRNVTESSFTGNPSTSLMGLTSKYEESSNFQEHKCRGSTNYSKSCSMNFTPNQILDNSNLILFSLPN